MKIIKRGKKAKEVDRYKVKVDTYEQYIEVLKWHKELGHVWITGETPLHETCLDHFNQGYHILSIKNKFSVSKHQDNEISFEEFLLIAYENN